MNEKELRALLGDARYARLQDAHKLTQTRQELLLLYLQRIERMLEQLTRREEPAAWSDN